ncbi:hypothetical protein AAFF_G00178400 [Aldrovandia affinis]|uniref:Uncharacterized protein n=1 Tax=Aldrovandia affinis TaxID=143900 RepID=A0AAD7RKU9_9TELE|nr:hypothetical protein AAFF_G00178400 [Aldrovandia affinis]
MLVSALRRVPGLHNTQLLPALSQTPPTPSPAPMALSTCDLRADYNPPTPNHRTFTSHNLQPPNAAGDNNAKYTARQTSTRSTDSYCTYRPQVQTDGLRGRRLCARGPPRDSELGFDCELCSR